MSFYTYRCSLSPPLFLLFSQGRCQGHQRPRCSKGCIRPTNPFHRTIVAGILLCLQLHFHFNFINLPLETQRDRKQALTRISLKIDWYSLAQGILGRTFSGLSLSHILLFFYSLAHSLKKKNPLQPVSVALLSWMVPIQPRMIDRARWLLMG